MKRIATIVWLVATAATGIALGQETLTDLRGARAVCALPADIDEVPGAVAGLPAWQPLGLWGGDVEDIAVYPLQTQVVLAGVAPGGGTGGTLYRSTDGGTTWTEVAALHGNSVFDIEFTPTGTAIIATADSIWTSANGGSSWTRRDAGLGLQDIVYEISVDPNNGNNVWAGVTAAFGQQTKNVIRSVNGGVSWSNVTPPLASPMTCRSVVFDPINSNNVYASFEGNFGGSAFWYSNDYGTTWFDRTAGLPAYPLYDVEHDGTRVYVTGGQLFGSQNVGLYVSTNHGQNWTPLHDGTWPIRAHADLEIDPSAPDTLYLASFGAGLYRSTNGGVDWEFGIGGTAGRSLNDIAFVPGDSTQIYLGAASVGALLSVDAGDSFAILNDGINALEVTTIAVNPLDGNEFAAGFQSLNSGGVYTSLDGGETWDLEPVPGTRWNLVAFHPNDGTLYAISGGPTTIAQEGVYRRNLDGTWTNLGPDQGTVFESELFVLRFSENNPNLFMAAGSDFGVAGSEATVWRSLNAGGMWTKVYEKPEGSEDVTALEILADGTDMLMAASYTDSSSGGDSAGGALRTVDGGATWNPSSTGLAAEVQGDDLCASPFEGPYVLYLADSDYPAGGTYKSVDGGATWANTGYTGYIYEVIADPQDANLIYVMNLWDPKLLRSSNNGATFTPWIDGLELLGSVRGLIYTHGTPPLLLLCSTTGVYTRAVASYGDMNCDGFVNNADIPNFIDAITATPPWRPEYYAEHPDCAFMNGDINHDGVLNNADIPWFVDLLTE